jgi:serine-type D-Ala-D-Ala carboxypeptidase/endopeptidase (penicillin-binding protein 4)
VNKSLINLKNKTKNMILSRFTLPFLCLLALPILTNAQDCADKVERKGVDYEQNTDSKKNALIFAVNRLADDSVLKHGQSGIVVMDAQTGEVLASRNACMSVVPASNMKIVTTAAALGILGKDFRFRTELQHDGYVRDSVLYGYVFIKGYGDPTLASPEFEGIPSMTTVLDSFSGRIKALGIRKIVGKIVGDGSVFEPMTAVPTWLWEDLGNYYGVGPSGLNFHENLYHLNFFQNPNVGSSPSILGTTPQVPDFQLINEVKSAKGGGDDAYIYSTPYATVGTVGGKIPAGSKVFSINGALPDPPYFAAWHLRKKLLEIGIEVPDSATTQLKLEQKNELPKLRQTFYAWFSPTLETIIKRTNLESVNLYCEAFVRTIALQRTSMGTNDAGTAEIVRYWRSKGIDTEGLFMQDGSGLAPRNGVTALQLASILKNVAADSLVFSSFYGSLPEAGKSGTMKGMFKNNFAAQQRIRAKSGTITRVKSYSGYVTTTDGRLLIFSAICNNFTCSQRDIRIKLEQFMTDLLTY